MHTRRWIGIACLVVAACGGAQHDGEPSARDGDDATDDIRTRYDSAVAQLRAGDPEFASAQEVPGHRVNHLGLDRIVADLVAACEAGLARACGEAGWWLSFGPPAVSDAVAGRRLVGLGVAGNDPLAMFIEGASRLNEESDGEGLVRQACAAELGYACSYLALRVQDEAEAQAFAERGCLIGDATACGLSSLFAAQATDSDAEQRASALRAAERGCEGADFISCATSIRLTGDTGDDAWARVNASSKTPRGAIPLSFGRSSRHYHYPSTGTLYAVRMGEDLTRPRTLAYIDVAVSPTRAIRITQLIRSRVELARIAVRSAEQIPDDCELSIRQGDQVLRFETRHNHHPRGDMVSTRVHLDQLAVLGDPSSSLLVCGEAIDSPAMRRLIRALLAARETLYDPEGDTEDWAPG